MNNLAQNLSPSLLIREATAKDVDRIFDLIDTHSVEHQMLPRSKTNILDNLLKFNVIELNDEVIACAALEIFTAELCEIRSLVVAQSIKQRGYGRIMVETLITKAQELRLQRIMALTYVPEFFHRLGFRTVPKEIFPEKVWGVCAQCSKFNSCDEIAVVKQLT